MTEMKHSTMPTYYSLARNGPSTAEGVLADDQARMRRLVTVRRALHDLVAAGYAVRIAGKWRCPGKWALIPGVPSPRQCLPDKGRVEPMAERVVVRGIGSIPAELLAKTGLTGLVMQQMERT